MRTLAELRMAVMGALGFIDNRMLQPTATVNSMRDAIKLQLGLAKPITLVNTRTLLLLRQDMLRMLGFAVQAASPPPGMLDMLTTFLNQAQEVLFRRYELDNGGIAAPTPMVDPGDVCSIDYPVLLNQAMAYACAHYQKPDAGGYQNQVEQFLKDTMLRDPPAVDDMVVSTLRDAYQIVAARYQMDNSGVTFPTTLTTATEFNYIPVQLLATAMIKERMGQGGSQDMRKQYEQFFVDMERRTPANAVSVVNRAIIEAQHTLFMKYDVMRVTRIFTWTLVPGTNMYDFDANDEQTIPPICPDVMSPHHVFEVAIQRYDDASIWYDLIQGIPMTLYNRNDYSYYPSRYEMRKCIEIWPSPGEESQKLRIKAQIQLREFAADEDEATIDDHAIFLLATANAKAYFNQRDAQAYAGSRTSQLEQYIGGLVSGSHQTARYIPGQRVRYSGWVEPKPTVPFP